MPKEIKWLTQAEINKAAEKSKKAAILISIEHWKQIRSATEKQYEEAYFQKLVGDTNTYCGLCQRYQCRQCPLSDESLKCCREWGNVRRTLHTTTWQTVRKYIDKLIAKLESLL